MRTRSRFTWTMVLLSLLALSAACGGDGGGGGVGGGGGPAVLPDGTFIKTVNTTTFSTYVMPFNQTYSYYRTQSLYTANTISASGRITGLSLLYSSAVASVITCPTVTIKIGHTIQTALTVTFADNHSNGRGGQTTVLSSGPVTIPAGDAGDWLTITFATPFDYNGSDNLVVDIERNTLCSGTFQERVAPSQPSGTSVLQTWNSPAGILQTWLPITKFHFTGGDTAVEFGGTIGNNYPFRSSTVGQHVQLLYRADEINGSGPVTGVGMQIASLSTQQSYTYTVKLGHATVSGLTSTFAENYAGSPATVANSATVTIPANIPAGSYVWIPLTGSFIYNGIDNLIVDINVHAGTGTTSWMHESTTVGRRAYGSMDSTIATGVDAATYHIKLRFKGGTIDSGQGAASTSDQVFEGDADGAQIQSLYHAAELGTGGTIASISLRLFSDSNAAIHSNYTVKIGHTAKTQLSGVDSYASNMDENLTVHNGSFSIPAGLKAGDWVTIPLSPAFPYNPAKNLAVLFSTAGGAGVGNTVRWKESATQYPARVVGSEAGANTTPTWTDYGILEVRFHLQ